MTSRITVDLDLSTGEEVSQEIVVDGLKYVVVVRPVTKLVVHKGMFVTAGVMIGSAMILASTYFFVEPLYGKEFQAAYSTILLPVVVVVSVMALVLGMIEQFIQKRVHQTG